MAQQILAQLGHRMHLINPHRFSVGGGGPYEGTNLVTDSNDQSTVNWKDSGPPTYTTNTGGGIGGNNSMTIEDESAAATQYVFQYYDNGGTDTNYWTARYFVKKNTVDLNPPYAELQLRFHTSDASFLTGDGVSLQIDTSDGSVAARATTNTGGNHNWSVASYDDDWWEVKIDAPNTGRQFIAVGVHPAASGTLGGSYHSGQSGGPDIANIELYGDTSIEDVSGGPVYT